MSIPIPKPYIAAFETLGFGMFVHWGLYSQLGRGEWVLHDAKIEPAEYEKLSETFCPAEHFAEELAKTAKEAGCKYIVLTTRHHDGFSLYDTKGLNDYDAVHTPSGRDVIREYVDACRKYEIVPFFYHTTLDWRHPDFDGDFDRYLEYLNRSIEILCTNYGKIGGFWFDGNWSKPEADWKEDMLYATIRKYQPEAMIINNTGLQKRGETGHPEIDAVTYERGRPEPMDREGMPKYIAGEMCETINDHWGIGFLDINYKSPANLIESLCRSRKVGANFLMNIGPAADGTVDPYQKELLRLIGKWTKQYGEAIYDVKPYPAENQNGHFIVKGKEKLYLFCMNIGILGDENVTVDTAGNRAEEFLGVPDKIKAIRWMDNGESLKFEQTKDMLSVCFTKQPYGVSMVVRVAEAEI